MCAELTGDVHSGASLSSPISMRHTNSALSAISLPVPVRPQQPRAAKNYARVPFTSVSGGGGKLEPCATRMSVSGGGGKLEPCARRTSVSGGGGKLEPCARRTSVSGGGGKLEPCARRTS